MNIEVKNYTYDEMPEFNEEVEGAHSIQMTGEEVGLEYHPQIIYDKGHNLHLYMIIPTSFNHPKRRYPCIVYIQGSAWRKQRVSIKVPYLSALAKKGYVIAIVEYRDSSIAHFPCCIEDGKNALAAAKAEITDGENQLAAAKKQIEEKEDQLESAETELADGLQQYQENQSEFDEQMQDAEAQIADAQSKIDEIEKPETYVLDRNTNVGYVCLKNDSGVVKGIANVFPVFFFLVAALICMTTMNRMVEEQRTQIGVLKALGFSEGKIMGKNALSQVVRSLHDHSFQSVTIQKSAVSHLRHGFWKNHLFDLMASVKGILPDLR